MSAALEVHAITKRFERLTAVDAVSFEVRPGQICGFIGPNGAGKTTTMRIIATLELPDEGDVLVNGHSVLEHPREVRRRLGFMPDSYGAYANTTVQDYLDFYARAYGLRGRRRAETLRYVIDFTGLEPLVWKEINSLSKGMKQRLCLAKTLLHDPALLILDEPASGLDPRARVELRELVQALGQMDKAVLISSHILSELSEICDTVAVIESGRICGTGSVAQITRELRPRTHVFLRALASLADLERALREDPRVDRVHRERDGFVCDVEGGQEALADLVAELVRRGLRPVEVAPEAVDLEDIFLSLTKGRVQ